MDPLTNSILGLLWWVFWVTQSHFWPTRSKPKFIKNQLPKQFIQQIGRLQFQMGFDAVFELLAFSLGTCVKFINKNNPG